MKAAKRILSPIIALCMVLCAVAPVSAEASILSGAEINKIAYGITEYHLQKNLYDGMQNIFVTEVDLTRDYIDVEALYSDSGISRRSTVLNMAKSADALVAVNADFFQISGSDSMSATPLGTLLEDGELLSTPALGGGVYATAGIKSDGTADFSYWTQHITLTAPDGESTQIHHINKFYDEGGLILITSEYSGNSIGGDYEMIVNGDGIVTDLFESAGVLQIPEGSFVIASNTYTNTFLIDHFKVGDEVKIEYDITPSDYEDYAAAVGGGTLLLKDGAVAEITHSTGIAGYNPRTAMGASADGKTLYIVTVDGRADNAYGMTLPQLADFMLQIGCSDAINFDGGGSTTYVSKTPAETEASVKNQLSDGYQRPVSTGVGVTVSLPAWETVAIDARADQNETFVGGTRNIDAVSIDVFYNESIIDPSEVTFSVEGIEGEWNGSEFTPTTAGSGLITVTYGSLTAQTELLVYENPVSFEFEPSYYTGVEANSVLTPKVYGIAPSGSRIEIPLSDVSWQEGSGIEAADGGIKVLSSVSGSYRASIGDMYAYLGINTTAVPSGGGFTDTIETEKADKDTKIAILGELGADTLYKKAFASPAIAAAVNASDVDAVLLLGESDASADLISAEKISVGGFEALTVGDVRIIKIDNSGGGISETNSDQWSFLESELAGDAKNVIVLMPESYYTSMGGYSGRKQFNSLVQSAAEDGKNVCVVFKNASDSVYIQDGVRYIGVRGTADVKLSDSESLESCRWLLFGADAYGIQYEIMNSLR